MVARAFGGRLKCYVFRTVQTVDVDKHILGLHDVAALADRPNRPPYTVEFGKRNRWYSIRMAISSTGVRFDGKLDAIWNSDVTSMP